MKRRLLEHEVTWVRALYRIRNSIGRLDREMVRNVFQTELVADSQSRRLHELAFTFRARIDMPGIPRPAGFVAPNEQKDHARTLKMLAIWNAAGWKRDDDNDR